MTFRPYAWKIRLGNTENFLDIDDLTDGYLLWRNGSKVMSTLIDQGKLSLSAPQNPNDAATKQYVDDSLGTDESSRVAADVHLQSQIDALLGTSLASGDKGDITIAADGYEWTIDAGAVTNTKLAVVASGVIKGRASAGAGAVEDLTGTQATALLDVFNAETKGLAPAATGGGSTNFLRADGAWAAPPAGTVTGVSVVSANGLAGTVANSGTTPAITMSTSVTGVLKGNGTAISAAVSGTDYAPATSGTGILSGNGSGGFSGVTVGTGLAFSNGALSSSLVGVTDGDKGDITVASTGTAWTIDSAAVTNAKMADMPSSNIKGRGAGVGAGPPQDITLGTSLVMGTSSLMRSALEGDVTAPLDSKTLTITAGVVSNSKLANVTGPTIKGRVAGTGSPADLTSAEATSILDAFTSTLKGLAPASGGGTANYLRADGSWATPPGTATGTVTGVSVVSANGLAGTVANSGTTPAITLSTSITGVLKGNGTAISAAVSGTDYAPATSGTSILYGNNSGGFSSVTVGTGLSFSAGTLSSSLVGVTDGDKGDITVASTGTTWTIDASAVTNAKIASMPQFTIKGNNTGGPTNPLDLTVAQTKTLLAISSGDVSGLAAIATSGSAASLSTGIIPDARMPNFTGDVTTTEGAVATTIAANAVSDAKLRDSLALSVIGRSVNSLGDPGDISAAADGHVLRRSGTSLGFGTLPVGSVTGLAAIATSGSAADLSAGTIPDARMPDLTGDVTTVSGAVATTIVANVVTNTKLADMAANTIKGNNTGSSADPADLTTAQVKTLLAITTGDVSGLAAVATSGSASDLGTGTLPAARFPAVDGDVMIASGTTSATIKANAVTNAMLSDMFEARIKGRAAAAGSGDPTDLTAAQATAILDVFTTTLKGLAPASGGGEKDYLRADGTWATPPGSGNYVTLDTVQTMTAAKVISVSSTSAALRVTQAGTGESFRVEDSANPDSTPFVITNDGNVGIGIADPSTKLHISGVGGLKVDTTGDTWADFGSSSVAANYLTLRRPATTTALGFIGSGGGGALSAGFSSDLAIRSDANMLLATGGDNARLQLLSGGSQLEWIGNFQSTTNGNITMNASIYQFGSWISSFTGSRTLSINNLTDGRWVQIYIRNTNATPRQISIQASTTTASHSSPLLSRYNSSTGGADPGAGSVLLAATSGAVTIWVMRIGSNFIGSFG